MAAAGLKLIFHGAFAKKAEAVSKERSRPGTFVLPAKIHGHQRWLVVGDVESEHGSRLKIRL